ncbi:putative nuclease harbi1 [Globomyces sp. JEL0801]|nr:putative nuclease harbi1 [Globomyces sp. JEL0801]
MSYSIRSGSQNDKGVFSRSAFGNTIQSIIPSGTFIVADAGYQLLKHVITPYPITYGMDHADSYFNYIPSKTRLKVECAFGLLKNRFRIFQSPLLQKKPETMGNIIVATLILHNWIVDLHGECRDDLQLLIINEKLESEYWMHLTTSYDDIDQLRELAIITGLEAQQFRNELRDVLFMNKS